MAKGECTGCGLIFKSTASFDKHRTGAYTRDSKGRSDRHCLTVDEMLAKGMVRNEKGWWITSAYDANAHEQPDEDEPAQQ